MQVLTPTEYIVPKAVYTNRGKKGGLAERMKQYTGSTKERLLTTEIFKTHSKAVQNSLNRRAQLGVDRDSSYRPQTPNPKGQDPLIQPGKRLHGLKLEALSRSADQKATRLGDSPASNLRNRQ
jgi:hypothetical protein